TSDVPFAKFVPTSAKLFVAVRGPGRLNEALDRTHAWELVSLFGGIPKPEADRSFDLRGAVRRFLGPHASVDFDELLRSDAGLIAPSWSELGSAVWFAQLPDEGTLDRWFPRRGRVDPVTTRGLSCFRTKDGMIVCTRDETVAISRRWKGASLMRDTLGMMDRPERGGLEQSETFRNLMRYLPPDYLAVVYWADDEQEGFREDGFSPLWPPMDRGVMALYEGEGRIDVAIRGSLSAPKQRSRLSRRAVDAVLRLPRTTLYATATTVDLDAAYKAATAGRESGVFAHYLNLLRGIQRGTSATGDDHAEFGPHVIFVWGQDLTEAGSSPQLAALIECSDAASARQYAKHFAEGVIRVLTLIDSAESPDDLEIHETRHLGVPVSYVSLENRGKATRVPVVELLSGLQPAWAAHEKWLIVALNRAHVERILDAQFNFTDSLGSVRDVRDLSASSATWGSLSVAQASLASNVLARWLEAFEAGAPSLLDPVWWKRQGVSTSRRVLQLGIGMRIVQEPGVVVITKVFPHTAADGRLRVGDRVLGIDGNLLSLEAPNADLRKRWSKSGSTSGPVLRVERDGTATDVVVPKRAGSVAASETGFSPADAVRELASLATTLQFASFAVDASDPRHYSARLSLRFVPEQLTKAPPR
ncbi:MAG: hypothetical protein PVI86_19420, partial [Phycisphaerae bacterium]